MIYHVFANRSNVGDWLSAQGIQRLLALPVVELLCDEPFVPDTIARLSTAGLDDLVVIGGGGLFMDYFMPFWTAFEPISRRVPFCIWGVGCCDMKRAPSMPDRALLGRIVERSRLCSVRDELTRDFLAPADLPPPVACASVAMLELQPPGHGVLHVDALDNVGTAVYDTMDAVAREFGTATTRTFRAINNEIPADSRTALASVIDKYRDADVILSGRLHGCILGLGMGRRVLAVSGDRKIESFMDAAGLGDWVLGVEAADQLEERLNALPQQTIPAAFLQTARLANRDIARAVHATIDAA